MSAGVFGHGQLRLYLLVALQEGPASGYDIIRALQDRFAGLYSPSAGTVYPRLAKLEEEGRVRRHDEGRRATYELTDAGRVELAERTADVAQLEADVDAAHRRLADEMRSRVASGSEQLRAELEAAARLARAAAAGLPGIDGAPGVNGVGVVDGADGVGATEAGVLGAPDGPGPAAQAGPEGSRGGTDGAPGAGGDGDPFRAGTDWSDVVRWFTHTARSFESRGRDAGPGSASGADVGPGAGSADETADGSADETADETNAGAPQGDRARPSSPEQWLRVVEIMRDAGRRIQEVLGDGDTREPGGGRGRAG